jgi:GT2 family glycosyltransferase
MIRGPVLSIVVVNWNTRDLLRDCLASIRDFAPPFPYETIVVDNASQDGSAAMVQAEFPWARCIALDTNTGYAAGNNAGFREARGEFLLTLNPDTRFVDDTLRKSVETLQREEAYGVVAARLVGLDRQTQRSVRGFPTLLGVFGAATGLDSKFPASPFGAYSLPLFDYEQAGPAPQPMGTFLLFRREALADVGPVEAPFDLQFPIFFNEVDLLFRLHKAGWPCYYDPACSVVHVHGASTRQVRPAMVWESHRGLVRYFRKHLRGFARLALPVVAAASHWAAWARSRRIHAAD